MKDIYMAIKELGEGYSDQLKDAGNNTFSVGNNIRFIVVSMKGGLVVLTDNEQRSVAVNQANPVSSIQDWIIDKL